jgi:hypothetical protein
MRRKTMNAKLTYSENTPKTFNNAGRPVKGFEKWRKESLEAEPMKFKVFLRESFEDIEQKGGEITLGFVENGIWMNYTRGMTWNRVKVQFPGEIPKYRRIESFEAQYFEYVKKFKKWQARFASL